MIVLEDLNVTVQGDTMAPPVPLMSMSVPPAHVSMEGLVKMDSMSLSANASLDLKGKGVRQKLTYAKAIPANTVESVPHTSIPTPANVLWASLETTAKKTSMIARALRAEMEGLALTKSMISNVFVNLHLQGERVKLKWTLA